MINFLTYFILAVCLVCDCGAHMHPRARLRAHFQQLDERNAAHEQRFGELYGLNAGYRQELDDLRFQLQQLYNQNVAHDQKFGELDRLNNAYRQELNDLKAHLQQLYNQNVAHDQKFGELYGVNAGYRQELDGLRAQLNNQNAEHDQKFKDLESRLNERFPERMKEFPWTNWRRDAFIAANRNHDDAAIQEEISGLGDKSKEQVFEYFDKHKDTEGRSDNWRFFAKPDDWMMPYEEIPLELTTNVSQNDWKNLELNTQLKGYWARIIVPRNWIDKSNTQISIGNVVARLNDEEKFPLKPVEEALMENIVEGIRENRKIYDKSIEYLKLRLEEGEQPDSQRIVNIGISPKNGCLFVTDFPRRVDYLEKEWVQNAARNKDSWIYASTKPEFRDVEKEVYRLWRNRCAVKLEQVQKGIRDQVDQCNAGVKDLQSQLNSQKAVHDQSLCELKNQFADQITQLSTQNADQMNQYNQKFEDLQTSLDRYNITRISDKEYF